MEVPTEKKYVDFKPGRLKEPFQDKSSSFKFMQFSLNFDCFSWEPSIGKCYNQDPFGNQNPGDLFKYINRSAEILYRKASDNCIKNGIIERQTWVLIDVMN